MAMIKRDKEHEDQSGPDVKTITVQELIKLPLAERRRIMRQQAETAREYYLNNPEMNLGGGDFIDY